MDFTCDRYNLTIESISIGKFKNKKKFHYIVLQFLGVSNITEQGNIISQYLKGDNFLLLPRSKEPYNQNTEAYNSLLLLWTDDYLTSIDDEIVGNLRKLFETEVNNVRIVPITKFILNNGKNTLTFNYPNYILENKSWRCSYLITHQYKNENYHYRISSSISFKKNIELLENYELGNSTVLDLTFTGRDVRGIQSNCYDFNNYKIKDYYIKTENGHTSIILSNVKGVIDMAKFSSVSDFQEGVTFLNLLFDWKNPLYNDRFYYYGMPIRFINFYPQEKVVIKEGRAYTKDTNKLINQCFYADTVIILGFILSKNKDKRYDIIREYFSSGIVSGNNLLYENEAESLEEVIRKFSSLYLENNKKNAIRTKNSIINSIKSLRITIQERTERKIILENRTKEFIPFPKIVLPKEYVDNGEIIDILSMVKEKDGIFYIEEGE